MLRLVKVVNLKKSRASFPTAESNLIIFISIYYTIHTAIDF